MLFFALGLVLLLPICIIGAAIFWRSTKYAFIRRVALSLTVAICAVLACQGVLEKLSNRRVEALRFGIEKNLRNSLGVGDSRSKIESVLMLQGLNAKRDDILHEYFDAIPTEQPDTKINVTILVNEQGNLTSMSVKCFYIFL